MRFLLATALVAISTPAAAESDHALRDAAVRLFESQDYAGAAEAFQRCYQIEHDPSCLYGLGQAHRAAGDCERAVAAYRAFLRTSPASEPRQKAVINIAACEQRAIEAPTPAATTAPTSSVAETRVVTRPWYRDRLGGVLATGALVGTAVGATFLVLADRSRDAAVREGGGDGMLQVFEDHRAQADRRQLIGTAILGGAGALALTAVLRYALHDRTATVTVSAGGSDAVRAFALDVRF